MAWFSAIATVVLTGVFVRAHAATGLRALVALPAMMSAAGFLQVRRNTCVALAATGQREGDQGLETASPEEAAASRSVSREIMRGVLLVGAATAVVGVATTLIG